MAIRRVATQTSPAFDGTSKDPKPTAADGAGEGSRFHEVDTGDDFTFYQDSWVRMSRARVDVEQEDQLREIDQKLGTLVELLTTIVAWASK